MQHITLLVMCFSSGVTQTSVLSQVTTPAGTLLLNLGFDFFRQDLISLVITGDYISSEFPSLLFHVCG